MNLYMYLPKFYIQRVEIVPGNDGSIKGSDILFSVGDTENFMSGCQKITKR